jgi:hypothetical protein
MQLPAWVVLAFGASSKLSAALIACGNALSAAARHAVRPNPSLEATATGLALGPRGGRSYHPPRGPSANPAPAPQLKR